MGRRLGLEQKLALKLGNADLAALLIEAGFDNPAKIRGATDRELQAIRGIGPATVAAIREVFPQR